MQLVTTLLIPARAQATEANRSTVLLGAISSLSSSVMRSLSTSEKVAQGRVTPSTVHLERKASTAPSLANPNLPDATRFRNSGQSLPDHAAKSKGANQ
jgi:hypothetical protein